MVTLLVKPFMRRLFCPDCYAPGIRFTKANGLRRYPPAMTPKFTRKIVDSFAGDVVALFRALGTQRRGHPR